MRSASTISGFWTVSNAVFGPSGRRLERYFPDLKDQLPKAGLKVPLPSYLAGSILASAFAAMVGFASGFVGARSLGASIPLSSAAAASATLLGFAVTLATFYFTPTLLADSRRRKLDSELPFAVGHLSVLSTSGMTPENLFHTLAEEDNDGVMNQEARLVVRDMAMLGMDLTSALKMEMKRSPSRTFTEFLDGFLSASTTGASLSAFLIRAASGMLLESRIRAKSVAETIGVAGEVYTVGVVVAPLLLLIMFALVGYIGFDLLNLMYFISYFGVPVAALVSLLIADALAGGRA